MPSIRSLSGVAFSRRAVNTIIATDGVYADFAGAKIGPCTLSVGFLPPIVLKKPPQTAIYQCSCFGLLGYWIIGLLGSEK